MIGPDSLTAAAQIIVAVAAVISVIIALHRSNVRRLDKIDDRLDHVDGCLDKVQGAQNEAVLRATVEARGFVLRTDLEIELTRVRSAISNETASNSNSINRLYSDVSDIRARVSAIEAVQRTNIKRISDLIERTDKL